MIEQGTIVRVWDGNCFRVGRYEGTLERSRKRFGWRKVSIRVLVKHEERGWEFIWRVRRFAPENVRLIES